MANKFVSLLEDAGKDITNGISKVVPAITEGSQIGQAISPIAGVFDPALGAVLHTTFGVAAQTAQALTSLAKPGSTGMTKEQVIANTAQILMPTVQAAFKAAGKVHDAETVRNWISAAVELLDHTPATNASSN